MRKEVKVVFLIVLLLILILVYNLAFPLSDLYPQRSMGMGMGMHSQGDLYANSSVYYYTSLKYLFGIIAALVLLAAFFLVSQVSEQKCGRCGLPVENAGWKVCPRCGNHLNRTGRE